MKEINFNFSLRQLLLWLILFTTEAFYIVESMKAKRREEAETLINEILFLNDPNGIHPDLITLFNFGYKHQISFNSYLYSALEHKNRICRWKAAFFLADLEFNQLSNSQRKKTTEILSDPPFRLSFDPLTSKLVENYLIKIGKDAECTIPTLLKLV